MYSTRYLRRPTLRSATWIKNESIKRFSTNRHTKQSQSSSKDLPLYRKLLEAWTQTPTKWYPLPLAVGAILLVGIQYRHKLAKSEKEVEVDDEGKEIIKLKGPWHVHVIGALPLRNMSRLWGYLNSLELPIWFRPFGFKLYALIFGCNLDEIEYSDLKHYVSLGDFFYRRLKEGSRPVDNVALVSPADGKVLHFGTIKGLRVEQVKGITYSLDALLGVEHPTPASTQTIIETGDHASLDPKEFANINDIEYSLDQLIGISEPSTPGNLSPSQSSPFLPHDRKPDSDTVTPKRTGERIDASIEQEGTAAETLAHDSSVADDIGVGKRNTQGRTVKEGNNLYFSVIYLAPGDYHRFHSPTNWVVEKRRHFMGELYSVSPYMAKRLENLFVLNERVALLGRWKYGFFGMVPVGATNVGSICINFDSTLRTNMRGRRPPPGTYTEGIYTSASTLLSGQPLRPAEEMGGFRLGSTIVLVFEAPADRFKFRVKAGEKVKVGQALGDCIQE